MTFRNPVGSTSAMSLMASPAALPVMITAAGVAVTVAAAVVVYKSYKNYEEKKHKEEIEQIIHLYDKYLARIYIPDNHEIKGLPAIFNYHPEKPEAMVESMHFTDEQVDDIGRTMPPTTDILLTNYRQSVQNAILKLQDYYHSRKDHTDLTAGVVCYLLFILNNHCLNFEGYEYDIAYLDAITNFVNAYSSIKDRENSQEFSRLAPVYSYLLTAQQDLERHKDSMSLEGMITEMRDTCAEQSNQLLRCLTKMVTENKNWNLIPYATNEELQKGILRRKYIRTEIRGLVLRSDPLVAIPDSSYKDWLIVLAKYYGQTINPDSDLLSEEILTPNQLFRVPAFEMIEPLKNRKNKLSTQEANSLKLLEQKLVLAVKQFELCKNFMTTQPDPKTDNATPKYISISNPIDIKLRSSMMAQFATLIHQLISLQYMSLHLMKSLKQLGEIFVKNPNHFRQVFNVFGMLCKEVKNSIELFRKNLTDIQLMNKNAMMLEEQEIFPNQIKAILDVTYTKVARLDRSIKEYRDRVPKNKGEPTVESIKHEMFEVAAKLSKCYQIQIGSEIEDDVEAPPGPANTPPAPEPEITPAPVKVIGVKELLDKLSDININMRVAAKSIPALNRTEEDLYANLLNLRDNAAILLNRAQDPIVDKDVPVIFDAIDDMTKRAHEYFALTKDERSATAKEMMAFMLEKNSILKNIQTTDVKLSQFSLFARPVRARFRTIEELAAQQPTSVTDNTYSS